MSVIECVPNVSEGRRLELVEALAGDVRAVPGLALLDCSSDPSHNRSVFTMAGQGASIQSAVLALVGRAVAAIDLRTHQGAHPRIGAVDVVPLVPLAGATMAECVALAGTIGRAIAETFQVPVFLYEQAATQPARVNLANIRRGGFEGLRDKMTRPEWAPDFGPRTPHPTAGATVVGARRPLIAFNVNLATDCLDTARRIAAAVRESSGGLPFVKALGLPLEHRGIVQVSMNLTNFEATPIQAAFDRVALEADKLGVGIFDSELVGLIPRAALAGTSATHLCLRHFSERQILEVQIGDAIGPGSESPRR